MFPFLWDVFVDVFIADDMQFAIDEEESPDGLAESGLVQHTMCRVVVEIPDRDFVVIAMCELAHCMIGIICASSGMEQQCPLGDRIPAVDEKFVIEIDPEEVV